MNGGGSTKIGVLDITAYMNSLNDLNGKNKAPKTPEQVLNLAPRGLRGKGVPPGTVNQANQAPQQGNPAGGAVGQFVGVMGAAQGPQASQYPQGQTAPGQTPPGNSILPPSAFTQGPAKPTTTTPSDDKAKTASTGEGSKAEGMQVKFGGDDDEGEGKKTEGEGKKGPSLGKKIQNNLLKDLAKAKGVDTDDPQAMTEFKENYLEELSD